jgi:hypothetical protein
VDLGTQANATIQLQELRLLKVASMFPVLIDSGQTLSHTQQIAVVQHFNGI